MTIKLARDLPEQPFNKVLRRFNSKYWTIDYNALMVATIIPIDDRGFKVPAQWRTSSDFLGVRWESEDHFSHEYFRYATDNNYRDTILAFRSNPSEPDKFTSTITTFDQALTYRLVPYGLNSQTNRYEPLDPLYNTGRTYPADVIRPQSQWTSIPEEEMTPYRGRNDYIYILDFSDMRTLTAFDGQRIPPENIKSISFDMVEWSHGLGRDAMIQSMEQVGEYVKVKITGALPGSVLTKGDKLTAICQFRTTVMGGYATLNPRINSTGYMEYPAALVWSQPPIQYPFESQRDTNYVLPAATTRTWYVYVGRQPSTGLVGIANLDIAPGPAQVFLRAEHWSATPLNNGYGAWDIAKGNRRFGPYPVTKLNPLNDSILEITFDCSDRGAEQWINSPLEAFGYEPFQTDWLSGIDLNYSVYGTSGQELQFEVDSWSGFGTGEIELFYKGTLPGAFVACDALYSRYLKSTSPSVVINSTKYFVDMTTTGARTTITQRDYPQPAHDLMMTSGFDDGYNLTPQRQVDMVHALGYRGHWTKYLGMSHYFNGRTAWQDKETGEIIPGDFTNDVSVMFAGDAWVGSHFLQGRRPMRGADEFMVKAAELFGVAYGQVAAINGAVGSSSTERAAAYNPNDTHYDPDNGAPGGLWWWELEANKPGPALLACMNKARRSAKPSVVVWGMSLMDTQAISQPGDRDPKPTVERTLAATKAIFAYMRAQWGVKLPILIQETGWLWDGVTTAQQAGTPMYLSSARNTWGDVVFTWLSYDQDPAGITYAVDIFHPSRPEEVMRTIEVPGTRIIKGMITCDYPVELNVPDAVSTLGDQFTWSYLRWRVRALIGSKTVVSRTVEADVPEDNTAFVKKLVVMGINSLIGGYFNDLSDPLNPGGTGKPGRKDVVAASTFRRTFAQKAGLRDVEVMPVMTVVGSSPINPMPYQPGFPPDNYWWNHDTNRPGPNLVYADQIVRSLGRAPDFFVESGPGETTGIFYAAAADRPAIMDNWRLSNIAMLNWMRSNWGNAGLEIWFQGATTSFWGDPPPQDINAECTKIVRDKQTDMALEGIGFKMGSYVPNSTSWQTFRNEMADGLGWVHYSVEGYHAAAAEMGEAMALNINRAGEPPIWTKFVAPENLDVRKQLNGDIVMTWDARPGFGNFYFSNHRGDTGAPILSSATTATSYTFTLAAQIAVYGDEAHFAWFEVSEYDPASDARGPAALWNAEVDDPISPLNPIVGFKSQFAGATSFSDILMTWDASTTPGRKYKLQLRNVGSLVVFKEVILDMPNYNFTTAQQIAEYGFTVALIDVKVMEHDDVNVIDGPVYSFNGQPDEAGGPTMHDITGFGAKFTGATNFSDIAMTWDASPVAGRKYKLRNCRADSGAVFTEVVLSSPSYTFTAAQQTAEYGYTVGYIIVKICEFDEPTGTEGTIYTFSGSPNPA